MPELPEVETVKNQLAKVILNKKITNISTSQLNLRGKPIPSVELKKLINSQFINIYRRNKYLILETNNDFLVVHLGMTGQLILDSNYPTAKHIHMLMALDSREYFYYLDIRRFGKIEIYSKNEFQNYLLLPPFKNLGFEPLDKSFTLDKFLETMRNNKTPAKKFLMDAQYVCGIGNIYANEILFLTHINPFEPIGNISENTQKKLYKIIIQVLKRAVELGGSSISDFVHLNGSSGQMQNFYKVYGKNGEPCSVCETIIERVKQNGRSTFYCPHCQPLIINKS